MGLRPSIHVPGSTWAGPGCDNNQANSRRRDVFFEVDNWVFLRLQPYRQISLAHRPSHKLSRCFSKPFRILQLSLGAHIQVVFHVSKLKCCHDDPTTHYVPLPLHFVNQQPVLKLARIPNSRTILIEDRPSVQVLVQWENQPTIDTT